MSSMWQQMREAARAELGPLYDDKEWKWAEINGLQEKLRVVNMGIRNSIAEIKTMQGSRWAASRKTLQEEIDELKEEKKDLQEDLEKAFRELNEIKEEIQSIKDQYNL